jgi:hypothetical protein
MSGEDIYLAHMGSEQQIGVRVKKSEGEKE